MKSRYLLITLSVAGLVVSVATAQEPVQQNLPQENLPAQQPVQEQIEQIPSAQRPTYDVLRWREDWSFLAGPDVARDDFFDPIKYVLLDDAGDVWASFGGQTRLRVESWDNFNFDPTEDDTFLLSRFLFHGDVHVGEHLRIFAQGKSAFSTDRDLVGGQRTLDVDELDLQNGFVDLILPLEDADDATLVLRAGRQELLLGNQRLVSPLDWANTRRTFDGISAIVALNNWTAHAFWTQLVEIEKYDFNRSDEDTEFYGLYAAGEMGEGLGTDLYFLGVRDRESSFNGTTGIEDRYTIGSRLHGKFGASNFDYEVEGAYQFGEIADGDIDAYMVTGEVGYRFADSQSKPRVWLGAGYASGDEEAGGDVETFNQLFPLGHAYLGWADVAGRQNVIHVNPGLSFTPVEKLVATVQGHFFWRADTSDALYNAGGAVVRAGNLSDEREVGAEIDLLLKYQFDRHLSGLLGYSHVWAGDFIDDATPAQSSDIEFVYASLEYTF